MRRKDSGILTTTNTSIVKSDFNSGSLTSSTFVAEADRRYMVGANTPGFHRLKAEGKLIPHTPFTQVEWNGRFLSGSYTARRNSDGKEIYRRPYEGAPVSGAWRIQDFLNYDCDPTSSPPASDMEYAKYHLQQAASKIVSRGWDALTFAAEAKKTANMITGFNRRLAKLIGTRNPRDAYRLWLEGRYGWRTLAYDLRDIHNAAFNWDAKRKLFTERTGRSVSINSPSELVGTASWGTGTLRVYKTANHEFSIRGSVAGLFTPQRLRFDPINTAWELVPFSFVLDWVYGVGVALEANAFVRASTAHTSSVGFKCVSHVTYDQEHEGKPGYTTSGGPIKYEYIGTRVSRSPTEIPLNPRLTGRALTPDLALDMRAIAYVRTRL